MDDVFKGIRKLFMGFPRYDTQDTSSEIFQEVERATSVRFQDLAQFSDMKKKKSASRFKDISCPYTLTWTFGFFNNTKRTVYNESKTKQQFFHACLSQDAKCTGTADSTDHHQGECWDVPLRNSEADFSHADDVRK